MSKTRHIQTGEGRISYDDTGGEGFPIIFVPGMGDTRYVYRFVTGEFARRGFRVITMDVRGMGESSTQWIDYSESGIASDIVSLINHLELKSVILVGNSISAGAAVIVSAEYPELISKVVLVSPFARNVPISRSKLLLFRLAIAKPWGAGVWVNYLDSKLYPSRKPSDMNSYLLSLKTMLKQNGRMSSFQKMASTNHDKSEACLKRMKAPALIIMGSKDPDFPDPEKESRWLAEQTGARSVMIPGAGHYPQAEFSDEFTELLTDFIGDKSVS